MLSVNGYSHFGQTPKRLALAVLAMMSGIMLSTPAHAANITVASPVNGTSVSSPIWVRAHNVGCNGLSPTAFRYSIDNSGTSIAGENAYDIDHAKQAIASGTHTIHFKSWTSNGACPTVSTTFHVGSSSSTGSTGSSSGASEAVTSIPSNAIASPNLDVLSSWNAKHDSGTPGTAHGSTAYPATTPVYDDARKFYMTYTNKGGVRWSVSFGKSASATHFVLDTYVYFTDPSQVQNLELDLNQVMSNGATVIFGTQCSSNTKTWEYTVTSGGSHWRSSNVACDPRTWAAKTWHHVQIGFHRNSSGVATHDWVNLDGSHKVFTNATYNAAEHLGWQPGTLQVNYQMEGHNSGSGSITAYIHKMTIQRW
jgi:hypothetical protein